MIEYIFLVAGIIALIRAILGPTFADRLISIGTLVSISVILIVIYSVSMGLEILMDVAIVITMLSFVGTLAIAKFTKPREDDR